MPEKSFAENRSARLAVLLLNLIPPLHAAGTIACNLPAAFLAPENHLRSGLSLPPPPRSCPRPPRVAAEIPSRNPRRLHGLPEMVGLLPVPGSLPALSRVGGDPPPGPRLLFPLFEGNIAIAKGIAKEQVVRKGKTIDLTSKWTAIARKEGETWKLVRIQATIDPVNNPIITVLNKGKLWITGGVAGIAGLLIGLLWRRIASAKPRISN